MNIAFDPKANADLDEIFSWIFEQNQRAAYEVIARIKARVALLQTPGLEHMGPPGLDAGTRELIEYPYIIVYEIFEARDEIVIWSVIHGARDRQQE